MSSASGPSGSALPSPEDLKKYDAASPGLGRQIIEMVQEEQRHIHSMDQAQISLSRRGQLFGFIIAISFLLVAGVLVGLGHSVAGTIIGSVDLVGLTTVFVVGQRSQRNALEPSGPDQTDRLIRELRRSQSKTQRSRKRARIKPPAQAQQATGDSPPEAPHGLTAAEGEDATASAQAPALAASAEPKPSEGTELDNQPEKAAGDDAAEAQPSKDAPILTDEDIQLYRRLYEDSNWHPDQGDEPAS
jgi:uncharacterized membrane protein